MHHWTRRSRHPVPVLALAVLATVALAGSGCSGGREDPGAGGATAAAEATVSTTVIAQPGSSAPGVAPTTTVPVPTTAPGAGPATAVTTPAAPIVIPLRADFTGPTEVATAVVPNVPVYAQRPAARGSVAADWTFPGSTTFGNPTTFLVLSRLGDWAEVILPMRPNGTTGWVSLGDVGLAATAKRIVVDRAGRSVSVYDGTATIASTFAVVGKSSTPTPVGTFFVTDILQTDDPGGVYGPYVFALSARSESFEFWNGQEALVALHGTNQPDLIGTAASNGCVRLPNAVTAELVRTLPLGTPVYVI